MASDYLLKIEGIKGESNDHKHKDAVDIDSFSWGAANSGFHAAGGGGGAGKVNFQDVHFTAKVNKASPELMLACAEGRHIKKAELIVRKQGKDQQEFYVVTLEDSLVSSYQSGGSEGANVVPTDQFSLNFAVIKFDYKMQKPDGSLDAPVKTGWNQKQNKKA